MSLAREMAREEKASMFHDMRRNLWVTRLCAFLEDTGAHIRVEGLNVEGREGTPESVGGHGEGVYTVQTGKYISHVP